MRRTGKKLLTLAGMIATDEQALICDLAETYGVYDYKALPVKLLATLSSGLRDDSRIKKEIAGVSESNNNLLLATIADGIRNLQWMQTKDGAKGRNRPESILEALLGESTPDKDVQAYLTAEDYERERRRILGGDG